jgi:hypothetical protein
MMDRVRDAVLLSGADDWVMAGEFVAAARNVAQDRHIATTLALGVIREMLESGVIEAGDVLENDGFVPWGLEPAESADRIEQAWRDLGREPTWATSAGST